MARIAFDTCIETLLGPGGLVIPDNKATHKSLKSAALLKRQKCRVLFLPACSPDLNPVAMALFILRTHLGRSAARTCDTLTQALGNIWGLFSPNECRTYFNSAGYASC